MDNAAETDLVEDIDHIMSIVEVAETQIKYMSKFIIDDLNHRLKKFGFVATTCNDITLECAD